MDMVFKMIEKEALLFVWWPVPEQKLGFRWENERCEEPPDEVRAAPALSPSLHLRGRLGRWMFCVVCGMFISLTAFYKVPF